MGSCHKISVKHPESTLNYQRRNQVNKNQKNKEHQHKEHHSKHPKQK